MGYRITIDTGGTFTDAVVADRQGRFTVGKSLTTPDRAFKGMSRAIETAAAQLGLSLGDLLGETDLLIYGTTRATNAIVTGNTAKTAILLTEGFPDTLVLREGGKANPHDFSRDFPDPYIPRRYTFEIPERINSEGEIVHPLDLKAAREILEGLRERNVDAVAVCLLWSILNPAHENALGELIKEVLPDVPYSLSHELIPILREYRRASTTAIDASLKPLMQRHFSEMEQDLRAAGYGGELLASSSSGGCLHIDQMIERPVLSVKSGPAMAPVAGFTFSRLEGFGDDVIVTDTGGTTFDVGLVRGGALNYTQETWLGGQFSGHIVANRTVDMRSVGAGGGSIAWVDGGGLLRVGPQSAGSTPGPACYGNGGDEATVTDAAVVLGYIDPDFFLGGKMRLDVEAAVRVVERIANKIGQSTEQAAFSIMTLANETMIKAIQDITVAQGLNPRESSLIAGGGAAGLNIMPIAKELGAPRVVLPLTASALSACGMQFSDIVFDHAASRVTTSAAFDAEGVNDALDKVDAELNCFAEGLSDRFDASPEIDYVVEARYYGQVWELDVPLPVRRFTGPQDVAALTAAFHDVHERILGVRDEKSAVECLSWKGQLRLRLGKKIEPTSSSPLRPSPVAEKHRDAYFGGAGVVSTPIYAQSRLKPGEQVAGPAIIEFSNTTLVVYPGMRVSVSGGDNLILKVA